MGCAGAIAAGALAVQLASATGPEVVIATEAPFPPFTTLSAGGEIGGFDREIGDVFCARLGWSCSWVNRRFDQLLPGIMAGEFDLAMGGIAVTAERLRLVDFSLPYDKSADEVHYLGKAGAPAPDTARIGVQKGTIFADHVQGQGLRAEVFLSEAELLAALIAGQVDLGLGVFPPEQFADLPGFADLHPLHGAEIPDLGTAVALCKGNVALRAPLDAALSGMFRDGTIDAIAARWF